MIGYRSAEITSQNAHRCTHAHKQNPSWIVTKLHFISHDMTEKHRRTFGRSKISRLAICLSVICSNLIKTLKLILNHHLPNNEFLEAKTSIAACNDRKGWRSHRLKANTSYLQQRKAHVKAVRGKTGSNFIDYFAVWFSSQN